MKVLCRDCLATGETKVSRCPACGSPRVSRFQMVADERLRPLAPSDPERHPRIDLWPDLKAAIERKLFP